MVVEDVWGCCTASILVGMGGTKLAEFTPDHKLTIEEMKGEIGEYLNQERIDGKAVVMCITNNEQTNANQALKECGFSSSYWMSKTQHPETQVKLWWLPLNDKQENG